MKVGVSGASGKLGSATVAELQQRAGEAEIVAITRSPEAIEGAEARRGDYDDAASLVEAYQGLDRVLLIPSSSMQPGVRGTQLKAAIDAAVQVGVSHIFLVSAAGTREAEFPALGGEYWTAEQYLIKTAPRWTILRMNYYAEAIIQEIQMALGRGALAGLGDEYVAYVSRNDLAAAAAGALLGEGHAGAIYNCTGPEALTGADVAATASEVLGKPLSFVAIKEADLRGGMAQMGLPEPVANAIAEIKTNFVQGYFDVVTHDVERLAGRAPKSLREVLGAMQP